MIKFDAVKKVQRARIGSAKMLLIEVHIIKFYRLVCISNNSFLKVPYSTFINNEDDNR
jgi:hypothetical protein